MNESNLQAELKKSAFQSSWPIKQQTNEWSGSTVEDNARKTDWTSSFGSFWFGHFELVLWFNKPSLVHPAAHGAVLHSLILW